MEEAYAELYQEFLQLRSLCLRQAALLHQLTKALHKQQGAAIVNGEIRNFSIPVHCVQETPLCLQGNSATARNPAAQSDVSPLPRGVGTFSDLLTEDMSKLCMNVPHQTKQDRKQTFPHLLALNSLTPEPADDPAGGRTLHTFRMPVTDNQPPDDLFPSQPGGLMMSDVALQSHVCDFCQAVFPGDTTTKGEFLRHLYTHVT
ncbi:TRAF family member-associated NF-kappa-B activator [Aulostomus maculatus]